MSRDAAASTDVFVFSVPTGFDVDQFRYASDCEDGGEDDPDVEEQEIPYESTPAFDR